MKIGIIVQARMGSTRLPGKILLPFFSDKTLIETIIFNLSKVRGVKIVVATSENSNNDPLEKLLSEKGIIVFRGSEEDVLERFITAAEENDIDGIIRICSDNPFIDPDGLTQLALKAKTTKADYIGFEINNTPSILTHFGFWGEFVTLSALKKVAYSTKPGTPAHEHVTYHVYKHPEEYSCEWIKCPAFLQGRNDIRLTVDNKEDFENARQVYAALYEKFNGNFSLKDVVSFIDSQEIIRLSMLSNIQINTKK